MGKTKNENQNALRELVDHAKTLDIHSFLFIAPNGPFATIHFENMAVARCVPLLISAFHYMIDKELEAHPEWSKEYRAIYQNLKKELNDLVTTNNSKFLAYNKKHKTLKK